MSKGTYDKDIKGSVLIRTDEVTLKDMTVDGDLIIGCGAADGKITLDNVTVKGRLLVWGGGTKAVYCNNATQMPAVVVARVDDAVKVIYDRDSTLAVIDTIKVRITERAKQHKETEVIFTTFPDCAKPKSSSTRLSQTIRLILLLLLIFTRLSGQPT